jgi:site-specific DNA recombinase
MPNTNYHGSKQAILYTRVSGDEQAKKGYSLADQVNTLRTWALNEGYQVLDEVADEGWSGAYLERPGLDRVRDLGASSTWSA